MCFRMSRINTLNSEGDVILTDIWKVLLWHEDCCDRIVSSLHERNALLITVTVLFGNDNIVSQYRA